VKDKEDSAMMYYVETPTEVFYSRRKLDVQFKHIEYLWRDNARYKEVASHKWEQLLNITKKKTWEIV
jgi:hypothetical protein